MPISTSKPQFHLSFFEKTVLADDGSGGEPRLQRPPHAATTKEMEMNLTSRTELQCHHCLQPQAHRRPLLLQTLPPSSSCFALGTNGVILYGESMYPAVVHPQNELELVYGGMDEEAALSRSNGSVSRNKVGGNRDRGVSGSALKREIVKEAAAAAMILSNSEINQEEHTVDVHVLPATLA
ncbi:hypothetical protein ACLOJK_007535 [Asimina triloba]